MSAAQDKTTGVKSRERWRLLEPGEWVQTGDEYWSDHMGDWEWIPVARGSHYCIQERCIPHRRRIVQPELSRSEGAERIAQRVWKYLEARDWGNGGHLIAVLDLAEIIRAELAATDAQSGLVSALRLLAQTWRMQNGDYPESKTDCADELLAVLSGKALATTPNEKGDA